MKVLRFLLLTVVTPMFVVGAILMLYFVATFFLPFLELPVQTMNRLLVVMLICLSPLIIEKAATVVARLFRSKNDN